MKYTVVLIVVVGLIFQFASTKENGSRRHHSHKKVKHHQKSASLYKLAFLKNQLTKAIEGGSSTNILDDISNVVQNGLETLDKSVENDASIASSRVTELIQSTLELMGNITQTFAQLPRKALAQLGGLLNAYKDIVQQFVNDIPKIVEAIQDDTVQGVNTALKGGLQILNGFNTAITSAVQLSKSIFGPPIEFILKPVEIAFTPAFTFFKTFLTEINNGASNIVDEISKNIPAGI